MGEKKEKGPGRLPPDAQAQVDLRDEIERMHDATDSQELFWHAQRACALITLLPLGSWVDIEVGPDAFKLLKDSKFTRIDRPYIATRRIVKVGAWVEESQLTARASGGQNPQIVFQEVSSGNLGPEISINTSDFRSARIVKAQPRVTKTS